MSSDPLGDPYPCRIFPAENGGPGRGTDRAGGVGIGKPHSARSQTIQVWRFVKRAPITGQVFPTEVINEDKENIWCVHRGIVDRMYRIVRIKSS